MSKSTCKELKLFKDQKEHFIRGLVQVHNNQQRFNLRFIVNLYVIKLL